MDTATRPHLKWATLSGNLDFITPFVTMFFLMMYATVNFACFLLIIMKAPNFRPTFKYIHWATSLAGVLVCVVLMFVAVVYWQVWCAVVWRGYTPPQPSGAFVTFFCRWLVTCQALVVLVIAVALYKVVEHHARKTEGAWGSWGDARTGLRLEQVGTRARAQIVCAGGRGRGGRRGGACSYAKCWAPGTAPDLLVCALAGSVSPAGTARQGRPPEELAAPGARPGQAR